MWAAHYLEHRSLTFRVSWSVNLLLLVQECGNFSYVHLHSVLSTFVSVATVSCSNDVWLVHWYRQIDYDCKFLESRGIMDYSMLLGLHFRAPQYRAPLSPGPSSTPDLPPSESFTSNLDDGM